MLNPKEPDSVDIPVWIGHGTGRLTRRGCLPAEHPESEYNYIMKTYGVDPEKYGVKAPGPHCDKCGQKILGEYDDRFY